MSDDIKVQATGDKTKKKQADIQTSQKFKDSSEFKCEKTIRI